MGWVATSRTFSSHTLTLERKSGRGWVPVSSAEPVRPREVLRISVSGALFVDKVEIRLLDQDGNIIISKTVTSTINGNAWYDFAAPFTPGTYKATASTGLWSDHTTEISVTVSATAPAPPSGGPDLPVGAVLGILALGVGGAYVLLRKGIR